MKQALEGKSLAMKDTKKGTKGCLISMAKIIIWLIVYEMAFKPIYPFLFLIYR